MTLHAAWQRLLTPAPDSAVARNVRAGNPPWTEAVHLLWSAWLFITPLLGGGAYDTRWFLLTLASYPVFLLLYARTLLAPARGSWRYPLAMVVLSLLVLRWYPSGLSYFVFGCVMLGITRHDSVLRYLLAVVALNGVLAVCAMLIGYPWQVVAWMLPMTLIIGVITHVERTAKEQDTALKLSHDEVRRLAATAERERIGRDLHDLLGHTLSLITLKLELARRLDGRDPGGARRELDDAERVAREALAQVRSAVSGIRSTDLAAELASAKLMLASLHVAVEHDVAPTDLPPDVERALALVLREAVTNIARHAGASAVRISLAREARGAQLRVADDGRGGVAGDGNGLAGMRDRVAAIGGTLHIESPRKGGTRIVVQVPLPGRTLAAEPERAPVVDAPGPHAGAAA